MTKTKTKKNQKKKDQTKINIISIKKIIKLIWMIKLKTMKGLIKEPRKKKEWGWNRKKQIKSISH